MSCDAAPEEIMRPETIAVFTADCPLCRIAKLETNVPPKESVKVEVERLLPLMVPPESSAKNSTMDPCVASVEVGIATERMVVVAPFSVALTSVVDAAISPMGKVAPVENTLPLNVLVPAPSNTPVVEALPETTKRPDTVVVAPKVAVPLALIALDDPKLNGSFKFKNVCESVADTEPGCTIAIGMVFVALDVAFAYFDCKKSNAPVVPVALPAFISACVAASAMPFCDSLAFGAPEIATEFT